MAKIQNKRGKSKLFLSFLRCIFDWPSIREGRRKIRVGYYEIRAVYCVTRSLFLDFSHQSRLFFSFFEKSCPCVWSVRKKSLPLHSLSGKQPGWNPRMHFFARFPKGENGSLTDCEQEEERRQAARATLYIIYMCVCMHKQQSHSFRNRHTNEQWSRRSCPVRQNYKIRYYSEEFDPGSG